MKRAYCEDKNDIMCQNKIHCEVTKYKRVILYIK